MKKAAIILTIIISIASIAAGKIYWDQKIEKQTASEELLASSSAETDIQQPENLENGSAPLTKNLPKAVKEAIVNAEKNQKSLNFVIFGSDTSGNNKNSWMSRFENNIKESYPAGLIQVKTILIKDKTSKEVLNESLYENVVKASPDLVLVEPFLLEDNGKIGIENSLSNLTSILGNISNDGSKPIIMIQPSYPLYNAVFYPKEVGKLKEYAKKEGYAYVDHWSSWPKGNDPALKDYIEEDGSGPSSKGHEVWAEHLSEYFISKL
ncbi:hypothetical protein GKZ89_16635 [Bacillus mangrovi]|uniref:SGNH hydrolase-type esterase domain-containing protein n=1 Tax=Metabacillus mangrovi TaxID=1491830 RepID=A0A7X2V5Q2_9BACI|nr:hypothetical protein [Metabacillus mangrovi]MTH55032.1 hypothetical protein [Metabacillus mangrovi]